MKHNLSLVVKTYFAIVIVGAGLLIFGYAAVQQTIRLGANDPQWQLVQDGSSRLGADASPAAVVGTSVIAMKSSLAPFTIVTDRNYHVVASSGRLGGATVLPPSGSFEASLKRGNNWFTWQPAAGVREATIIMPFGGTHPGYILAARSLSRVEQNIDIISRLAFFTLIGIVIAPAILLLKRV